MAELHALNPTKTAKKPYPLAIPYLYSSFKGALPGYLNVLFHYVFSIYFFLPCLCAKKRLLQIFPFFSVWKRNAPYEIGYPLLYSTLIVLPVIPLLCFLIPSKESLLQQVSMGSHDKLSKMKKQSVNRSRFQSYFFWGAFHSITNSVSNRSHNRIMAPGFKASPLAKPFIRKRV